MFVCFDSRSENFFFRIRINHLLDKLSQAKKKFSFTVIRVFVLSISFYNFLFSVAIVLVVERRKFVTITKRYVAT